MNTSFMIFFPLSVQVQELGLPFFFSYLFSFFFCSFSAIKRCPLKSLKQEISLLLLTTSRDWRSGSRSKDSQAVSEKGTGGGAYLQRSSCVASRWGFLFLPLPCWCGLLLWWLLLLDEELCWPRLFLLVERDERPWRTTQTDTSLDPLQATSSNQNSSENYKEFTSSHKPFPSSDVLTFDSERSFWVLHSPTAERKDSPFREPPQEAVPSLPCRPCCFQSECWKSGSVLCDWPRSLRCLCGQRCPGQAAAWLSYRGSRQTPADETTGRVRSLGRATRMPSALVDNTRLCSHFNV